MRILMVLPTCCNGRMMRATRTRALLLLFKPTAHQLPAQFSPVTLLPAKLGVENSIHGWQPTSIRVPGAANADEPAPLVVFS